jgi:hypothetical protein
MKKLLMNASLVCVAFGTDGMELARVGDMRLSRSGGVSDTLAVRNSGDEIVRDVTETLRLEEFLLTDGLARLSFVKGTETDGIFVRGDEVLEKSYPCIRDFLGLIPADASHSFAVYKLWAETEELGRIQLSERHVDSERPLEHQTKILSSVENDESLSTKRTVQTFVELDGTERAIGTKETSIPYAFTERQDDRYADAVNDRRWTVRDYVRGNGETFSKDWQDLGLIVKRPPAPPVQAPIGGGGNSGGGGGYSSNIFEKGFQHVVGGCTVM